MKSRIFLVLILCFLSFWLHAEEITSETARKVAEAFFGNLNYQITVTKITTINYLDRPVIYVVQFNPDGYILISADNSIAPILSYSRSTKYSEIEKSATFNDILTNIGRNIYEETISNSNEVISDEVHPKWRYYLEEKKTMETVSDIEQKSSTIYLIKDRWNQFAPYNYLCPLLCPTASCDPSEKVQAVVGCTPLAMGRILRFWNYPEKGRGYNSYTIPDFNDSLYADFENTTYEYSKMYDNMDPFGSAALLLYHCGVAVNVKYQIVETGTNAGAQISDKKMLEHFRYFGAMHDYRDDADPEPHEELLCKVLDQNVPILYSSEQHTFILDAYEIENGVTKFNVKFGDEDYDLDSKFLIDALWYSDYHGLLNLQPPRIIESGTYGEVLKGICHQPIYGNSLEVNSVVESGAIVAFGSPSLRFTKGFKVNKGVRLRAIHLENDVILPDDPYFKKGSNRNDKNNFLSKSEIIIYPNPSNGIFTVELSDKATIEIFSTKGQLIYSGYYVDSSNNIDLSANPKGVYIIRINDGISITTEKIIIQ